MKFTRSGIAALAVLVIAASALVLTSIGSAEAGSRRRLLSRWRSSPTSAACKDRSFNQLANEGRKAIGKRLGHRHARLRDALGCERIAEHACGEQGRLQPDLRGRASSTRERSTPSPRSSRTRGSPASTSVRAFSKKPKNAEGVVFAEHEAGYLVGYLAGLEAKKEKFNTISAVGANNVPAIVRYISGYIQGAKKAYPGIKVLANYANDPTFNDQAKCHETALNQIDQGSHVVFQVAGGCGLGALQAAKEQKVWGIGVDADQRYLGAHIMTSALKRVDKAVMDLTALAKNGTLKTSRDYTFNLKNGGVEPRLRQPEDPACLRDQDGRHRQADRGRQDQGQADRQVLTRKSVHGGGHRPTPVESPRCQRQRRRRSSNSEESRRSFPAPLRTTTSISTSAAARCTRCSARTAPARRR